MPWSALLPHHRCLFVSTEDNGEFLQQNQNPLNNSSWKCCEWFTMQMRCKQTQTHRWLTKLKSVLKCWKTQKARGFLSEEKVGQFLSVHPHHWANQNKHDNQQATSMTTKWGLLVGRGLLQQSEVFWVILQCGEVFGVLSWGLVGGISGVDSRQSSCEMGEFCRSGGQSTTSLVVAWADTLMTRLVSWWWRQGINLAKWAMSLPRHVSICFSLVWLSLRGVFWWRERERTKHKRQTHGLTHKVSDWLSWVAVALFKCQKIA